MKVEMEIASVLHNNTAQRFESIVEEQKIICKLPEATSK